MHFREKGWDVLIVRQCEIEPVEALSGAIRNSSAAEYIPCQSRGHRADDA